ncbi:MAG: uroporphyrinogen decarboxylase family protein [Deltaproteobacteria bacterium]|nr:uroporphyrinogen decarboxylase family protein [Deltaproteobacteria bacterium]
MYNPFHRALTSTERVAVTLSKREPDRVPFFLFLGLHGAKELGMTIKQYFSRPENVVEAQLRMQKKYRSDCLYGFYYSAVEMEAWGAELNYSEDGPPLCNSKIINSLEDIKTIKPPKINESPALVKVLKSLDMLRRRAHHHIPIIGAVTSPFSLPVAQMGFDKYMQVLFDRPDLFERLMRLNEEFCVEWANAQLDAGASIISYFDPMSSTSIIAPEVYKKTGFPIAKRTITRISGPTATHLASGKTMPILDEIAGTGTRMIAVSQLDNIAELKNACSEKLSILGNLNGAEMGGWKGDDAENAVKLLISKAAPGGGFILSDNNGEIPYYVPEDVLLSISEAVHTWGKYPLVWLQRLSN